MNFVRVSTIILFLAMGVASSLSGAQTSNIDQTKELLQGRDLGDGWTFVVSKKGGFSVSMPCPDNRYFAISTTVKDRGVSSVSASCSFTKPTFTMARVERTEFHDEAAAKLQVASQLENKSVIRSVNAIKIAGRSATRIVLSDGVQCGDITTIEDGSVLITATFSRVTRDCSEIQKDVGRFLGSLELVD